MEVARIALKFSNNIALGKNIMGEKMNIQPPNLTEIKKAASDLYFDMDDVSLQTGF